MRSNQKTALKQTLTKTLIISFFTLSVVFAQMQLGSDINGEAAGDHSGISVSLSSLTAAGWLLEPLKLMVVGMRRDIFGFFHLI